MEEKPKTPKPWIRILRTAGLAAGVFLVLLFLMVMFLENSMIYFPSKYPDGDWDAAKVAPLPVEDVFLETADGVRIHGWWVEGANARKTILYFHGNAGHIADRLDWILALAELPANVLAMDYRGYGRSEGKPNEPGLYQDAEAAYRWITGRGIAPEDIIVYGKSLGGAPACDLASRFKVGGLIVQSSFTNAKDMASIMLPFAKWFIRTKFDNTGKIAKIDAPKLIVHSRDDEMIPFWMGEKLHEAASEPKQLAAFDGAGHNDLIYRHRAAVLAEFRSFLER